MAGSLWPNGLWPTRLLCPCDSPRKKAYWTGLPFPSPGDLPNPGTEPVSLESLASAARCYILYHYATWEAHSQIHVSSPELFPWTPPPNFLEDLESLPCIFHKTLKTNMFKTKPGTWMAFCSSQNGTMFQVSFPTALSPREYLVFCPAFYYAEREEAGSGISNSCLLTPYKIFPPWFLEHYIAMIRCIWLSPLAVK